MTAASLLESSGDVRPAISSERFQLAQNYSAASLLHEGQAIFNRQDNAANSQNMKNLGFGDFHIDTNSQTDGAFEHVAKKGDTYWAIAKHVLEERGGQALDNHNAKDMQQVQAMVKELAAYNNKDMNGGKIDLQIGEAVKIPPAEAKADTASSSRQDAAPQDAGRAESSARAQDSHAQAARSQDESTGEAKLSGRQNFPSMAPVEAGEAHRTPDTRPDDEKILHPRPMDSSTMDNDGNVKDVTYDDHWKQTDITDVDGHLKSRTTEYDDGRKVYDERKKDGTRDVEEYDKDGDLTRDLHSKDGHTVVHVFNKETGAVESKQTVDWVHGEHGVGQHIAQYHGPNNQLMQTVDVVPLGKEQYENTTTHYNRDGSKSFSETIGPDGKTGRWAAYTDGRVVSKGRIDENGNQISDDQT